MQTRSEVDPATSNGFGETVTTVEYDGMGRVFRSHVPPKVRGGSIIIGNQLYSVSQALP